MPKPSSALPRAYVAKPGWHMQTGQYGGKPAVLTYVKGKLVSGLCVAHRTQREALPQSVLDTAPSRLRWEGRANFRVLGQVRRGAFEALAILMPKGKTLITNLADTQVSNVINSGLVTPSLALRLQHNQPRKPKRKQATQLSVIVTSYTNALVLAWYRQDKSKVVRRMVFNRN